MASLPDKLGPFELLRRLGAGGMAETFVAVRRGPAGFEQRVCIKRILPAYESDQDFVTSFLAEARTSASLRHANIVQVLDFGEHEGSHYLALELIDGLDLRGLLQRDQALDAELVVLIASEVASALAYAHASDEDHPAVIHRDVSPSNVLVSRNGELKLTDFGIARVVGGSLHTASGVIKGKIPYMPPEYIDGAKFDARGDLFALGVMMFELLHGVRPFDGESELDTLRKIASGDRKPFTASAEPALRSCVERLLARDASDRFADARELLDALPTLHTHRARTRLAELVRARTSRVPGESQPPSRAEAENARTLPITPSSPAPTVRPPATQLMPSRKALLALGASTLVLLAVVITALFRVPRGPASASAPPLLPAPAAESTPPNLAPRAPARATPVTAATAPTSASNAESPSTPAAAPSAEQTIAQATHGTQEARALTDAPKLARPNEAASPEVSSPDARPVEATRAAETREPAPRAKRAELNIVVLPFGEVWVDGKHIGLSPQRLKLAPGTHQIAIGEGRPRETRAVELAPGERGEVVFRAPKRER